MPKPVQRDREKMVPEQDVSQLSQEILKLLSPLDLRISTCICGWAWVTEHYAWRQVTRQYQNLIGV